MPQKSDDSKGRPGQSRWLGFVQIVLILAVVAVALYFARAPERVEREAASTLSPEDTQPVVGVIRPERTGQSLVVELTGAVGLSERARLKAEVAGRVTWVSPKFSNGGSIEANETFVRIDPAEYELQVKVAEMAVKAAEARVRIAMTRGDEAAKAFAIAHPDAEVTDWMRRKPFIAKAQARLMKARAELDLARLQLERTNISLPYSSRVIRSQTEVGEYVGPDLSGKSPLLGVVYRTPGIADRCAHRAEGPALPGPGDRADRAGPYARRDVRRRSRANLVGDRPSIPTRDGLSPVLGSTRAGFPAAAGHLRQDRDRGAFVRGRVRVAGSRRCRSRAASGWCRTAPCAGSSPRRSDARTKAGWWKSSTRRTAWSSARCREPGKGWRSRWRKLRHPDNGV